MAEYSQPVFLDATVCSNFASTDGMDLLAEVLESPAVTPVVCSEIEAGLEAGHDYLHNAVAAFDDTLPIRGTSIDGDHAIRSRLDAGEAATLLAAVQSNGSIATDDLAARQAATERDVQVTGSIGLLVLAVDCDRLGLEIADEWLRQWQEKRGYYAPVDSIRDVLTDRD